jgi:dUTP pyrophosphatase
MKINFKVLNKFAKEPTKTTKHACGWDLYAAIPEPLYLWPFQIRLVSTGIAMAIPDGYEGQVRPRSGLSKKAVGVAFGTVDSDYRGEMLVNMMKFATAEEYLTGKFSGDPYIVQPGDRIAQLIIAPVFEVEWEKVDELDNTSRGELGFGSSGR